MSESINNWFDEIRNECWIVDQAGGKGNGKWLPIHTFNDGKFQFGMTDAGEWVVKVGSEFYSVFSKKNGVRLLTLLEWPYENFERVFSAAIERLGGDSVQAWLSLPIELVVAAGLNQRSNYWAQLALQWFPHLEKHRQLFIKDDLVAMSSSDWATQSIRHQAIRLLAAMRNT